MDFALMNNAARVSTRKLNELTINRPYKLMGVKSVTTRFGPAIVAELEQEIEVFLPKKLVTFLQKDPMAIINLNAEAVNNHVIMTYCGDFIVQFSRP